MKGALTEELRLLRDRMADSAATDAMRWYGAEIPVAGAAGGAGYYLCKKRKKTEKKPR